MLSFIRTLARIVFGWALASLAAGLVTVLFVDIDVLAGPLDRLPKTLGETLDLALLTATHIAVFAAIFVLITALISEWFSIRTLAFYLLFGIGIAFLGFSAQYASEVAGQPTILNNYALKAFMTVGLAGGFVYWLAAGQFAGRPPQPEKLLFAGSAPAAPREGASSEVVITRPPDTDERPRWRMPALERLRFAKSSPPSPGDAESEPTRKD